MPASGVPSHWHCHQRWSQATKPPCSWEQDIPVATGMLQWLHRDPSSPVRGTGVGTTA